MRRFAVSASQPQVSGRLPADARIAVVLNAAAGSVVDEGIVGEIGRHFREAGIEAMVRHVRGGDELDRAVARAVEAGCPIVVAAGGDGTVGSVGSILAGTDVAMGVLPLGTLNHFAKDAGIPLELPQAVRTIAAGYRARIDVGEVNGRIFLNNSSLGIYPDLVVLRKHHQHQGRSKRRAALSATWAMLRRHPFLTVRLSLEGREHVRRTAFVFVGNNEYDTEGFGLGGRHTLDGGLLSLYVAHGVGRWGLLGLVVRAFFGRLRQARDFDAFAATEIVVETPHQRVRLATDGEVNEVTTPLRYRIRPGALQVLVPAPGSA